MLLEIEAFLYYMAKQTQGKYGDIGGALYIILNAIDDKYNNKPIDEERLS